MALAAVWSVDHRLLARMGDRLLLGHALALALQTLQAQVRVNLCEHCSNIIWRLAGEPEALLLQVATNFAACKVGVLGEVQVREALMARSIEN